MLVCTNEKVNLAALRCCAANSLEQWCEILGWHQVEENDINAELPTYSVVRDPLPRFAHGFTEKMIFLGDYSSKNPEGMLVNTMGILVILFGFLVVY